MNHKQAMLQVSEAVRAAGRGDLATVERLRTEGVELDKSDFDGRTPLHNAAKNGEVLIVAFLLKTTRVNLEARDRWGMKPIDLARNSRHGDVIMLLENHKKKKDLFFQAMRAIEHGEVGSALEMLKEGCVSLNWFDYDDRTCLHVAASDGNIDILKRLLEEDSIDTNKIDRWGKTALQSAEESSHASAARLIDQYEQQQKLLCEACVAAWDDKVDAVASLISDGLNVNGTTYNGTTLLHVAVSRKSDRTVDLLIANGADYMKKDRSTKSPLDLAKEKGRREYVDKFEAKKREFENICNAIDAAACGDIHTLRTLQGKGLDLSKGDYDNRTPLHLAASQGRVEVAEFLLAEAKVDMDHVDRWGKSARDDAKKYGNDDVVEIIDKYRKMKLHRLEQTTPKVVMATTQHNI